MLNKIAYYRKKIHLSQDELSKIVGISRGYLSEIENNKANPSFHIISKISKALQKNVGEIFFDNSVHHSEQSAWAKTTSCIS